MQAFILTGMAKPPHTQDDEAGQRSDARAGRHLIDKREVNLVKAERRATRPRVVFLLYSTDIEEYVVVRRPDA